MMNLELFCSKLADVEGLSAKQQAEALLWYFDKKKTGTSKSQGELAKIIDEHGLGKPSSTILGKNLSKSPRTLKSGKGFKIKASARKLIESELSDILVDSTAKMGTDPGFLPDPVWANTRGYVEAVCRELNGCFRFEFYNAASVLVRRVIETLIIEAYVAESRENEIQDSDGNYYMLAKLISTAKGAGGLRLGRDAKKSLDGIKELGDRAAHNPRFNATKDDLLKVESGVRVLADELIALAGLRRSK